jgi:hypothetical protein
MATGGQLLDNASPPNQIPASKLPHQDHASGHPREWFIGRVRNRQKHHSQCIENKA